MSKNVPNTVDLYIARTWVQDAFEVMLAHIDPKEDSEERIKSNRDGILALLIELGDARRELAQLRKDSGDE